MSGPLVGLVMRHGPDGASVGTRAVLAAIAEELHGPDDVRRIPATRLQAKTGASLSTVRRAISWLRSAEWVTYAPQVGRTKGNAYRLGRVPLELLSTGLSTGVGNGVIDPVDNALNSVTVTPPSVGTVNPSLQPPSLPGLLIGLDGRDPGSMPLDPAGVLADVPPRLWPKHTAGLRAALGAAVANGHDANSMRAALAARGDDYSRLRGGGAILAVVAHCASRRPLVGTLGPVWCGSCHEATRMIETDPDRPYPCPTCRPTQKRREGQQWGHG